MAGSVNLQNMDGGDFHFVAESNRRALRSHAMKAHWRVRRRRASGPRSACNGSHPHLQPLRPRVHTGDVPLMHHAAKKSEAEPGCLAVAQFCDMCGLTRPASEALARATGAPSGSRLDPFDSLPIRLATAHHRLLHHWLSTSATKMLSHLPAPIIDAARDVWLPLDFSNAASYNLCMAHAAAHLEHIQGRRGSTTALEFKLEAMRIISEWIRNEAKALSDDMFAAVLRLLTYERHWGTESEWKDHHRGLLQMIAVRGGLEALANNWRLRQVAYLATLMVRPTWFDSSNHASGLFVPQSLHTLELVTTSEPPAAHLQCLWFLSLAQDIEHFDPDPMQTCGSVFAEYTHLQDALLLLFVEMEQDGVDGDRGADMSDGELRRLSCVFFIAILYRASVAPPLDAPGSSEELWLACSSVLVALDRHLSEYCDTWHWDVEGLYITLFGGFFTVDYGIPDRDYVSTLIFALKSLNMAARHGIERSLLQVMYQVT